MSSAQSVQGASSNAMTAAAEARRAAYTRAQPAETEARPQEAGEGARIAAERNDNTSERATKQRPAELELPGKTGRNLDFMA